MVCCSCTDPRYKCFDELKTKEEKKLNDIIRSLEWSNKTGKLDSSIEYFKDIQSLDGDEFAEKYSLSNQEMKDVCKQIKASITLKTEIYNSTESLQNKMNKANEEMIEDNNEILEKLKVE